ncbi:MAG TPA: hypothetical protein VHF92_18470 [Geodermatophilus sp.]|nr:hypothetical protein [Geodermatophilus sp.]
MQRIEIDGVPVFTAPGPGRITAALVFGVGLRDETFATVEVTHLVEHLVMGSLPKSHLKCNAVTDVDSTAFYATGRPEAVRGFLEGVCRALSDLPTDRMDLEVGILQAEHCSTADSTLGALWAARFGLVGPGLVVADGPGPQYLAEDVVRAHARRWFVRENAALWCHGALPEGLRLPLPTGPRPDRVRPAARPQTGPVWTKGHGAGVGLLLTSGGGGGGDVALGVGVDVLKERLRDTARHARGLSYHVDSLGLDLAADSREVAVVVDAREGQEGEVAGILWEQFGRLCAEGPTEEELAHAVAGFEEELDAEEDAVVESELADAAYCSVSGLPFRPVQEVLESWRSTGAEQVAAALRRAWASAILYVPEEVAYEGPGAPVERRYMCARTSQLPAGPMFRPPLLARLFDRRSRLALVVSETGLAHRDADGDVHSIPWELVEGAVPLDDGKGVFVVGRNLCSAVVHEDLYGHRAVEAVRAHVPERLWLTEPPRVTAVAAGPAVPVG